MFNSCILIYYFIYLETVPKNKNASSIKIRGQLNSLISKIKQAAESVGIDVDEFKQLLIICFTSEGKEI